jgi:[ribosomal protein S18]-alanine N-acetyltransferase
VLAFRAMQEGDLDAVLENELRAYAYPWTRGNFADCLSTRNDCRVAEYRQHIVGHGVLAVAAGEAHLLNVCISRDHQGRGFGRLLALHMLERAGHLAAGVVFLEVRTSNRVARSLYESLGFRTVGVRRDYYPAAFGHEDACVMALELPPPQRADTL